MNFSYLERIKAKNKFVDVESVFNYQINYYLHILNLLFNNQHMLESSATQQ